MKVHYLPFAAPDAAGHSGLPPELLTAVGARYSRSDEGLQAILDKIDMLHPEKSIDVIYKNVDYGHRSIEDMAVLPIFMDGISIWLAYYIFSMCPTGSGQESSTRYINLSDAGLISDDLLPAFSGISILPRPDVVASDLLPRDAKGQKDAWHAQMSRFFAAYEKATAFWTQAALDHPEVLRLPKELVLAASYGEGKASKTVDRLRRNYVFDRARVFLPIAGKTNMMLVMNTRGWIDLVQFLLAHPVPEAVQLGTLIVEELRKGSPRLVKHAVCKNNYVDFLIRDLVMDANAARICWDMADRDGTEVKVDTHLTVHRGPLPSSMFPLALSGRVNRYSPQGKAMQMTPVTYAIKGIGFAEARDLNRHRPGSKMAPLIPVGFHGASDQVPEGVVDTLGPEREMAFAAVDLANKLLHTGYAGYLYFLPLGFQHEFQHTTTANHFIYAAELRTGPGAHYRYAGHYREWLRQWKETFPETSELIHEGEAEPE